MSDNNNTYHISIYWSKYAGENGFQRLWNVEPSDGDSLSPRQYRVIEGRTNGCGYNKTDEAFADAVEAILVRLAMPPECRKAARRAAAFGPDYLRPDRRESEWRTECLDAWAEAGFSVHAEAVRMGDDVAWSVRLTTYWNTVSEALNSVWSFTAPDFNRFMHNVKAEAHCLPRWSDGLRNRIATLTGVSRAKVTRAWNK